MVGRVLKRVLLKQEEGSSKEPSGSSPSWIVHTTRLISFSEVVIVVSFHTDLITLGLRGILEKQQAI